MKHFLSIAETDLDELNHILDLSLALRAQRDRGEANPPCLAGKTLAMIFEKKSLRTRVSFQQAMYELGGNAINLARDEIGLGVRESAADVIRVLSGMVQGVCARVFEHAKLIELAQHSSVPIINALSDDSHPCQALADVMTIIDEFGRDVSGKTVAFIGDGNNVARSLATISGKLGMNFVLASPPGYELDAAFVDRIMSQVPSMNFELTHDAHQAVRYADAIYTDTWVSMGQEQEKAHRLKTFAGYCVDETLLAAAPKHAIVLHCLPAYRGLEIAESVMEGPASRVFPQAHNRLHAQKGLLAALLGGQ
jgi:ornithine carbamoyltransferase